MATTVEGGIEWFETPHGEDSQCARCGSSTYYVPCWKCGDEMYTHHDCGEDCCCCLFPEDNVVCDMCRGRGGSHHCLSGPEWCAAHPLKGREHIESSARSKEWWSGVD